MVDRDEFDDLREIGHSLVEYASQSELSGRGIVTELFPYIYVAARRLSTRAISEYLREKHQVKLSAASIAKALREPERHFEALADKYEPLGWIVADAHGTTSVSILESEPLVFEGITREPPALSSGEDEDFHDRMEEYEQAKSVLEHEWFPLDAVVRAMVLKAIRDSERDSREEPMTETEVKENDK